jgi:LmbE family N-acetylglucosaminyl deacetylase
VRKFVDTIYRSPLISNWRRAAACKIVFGLVFALVLGHALALVCAASIIAAPIKGGDMKIESPTAILHDLESFRQMGSVLYIAAHPDDENTELLAYLSRGRDYRTAYLSLTRGDGGQNILSGDLGNKLGVARTQELLAARAVDGARQYFSRAVDFGFSKDYGQTLNVWDKEEVLSDVVRIIRTFHPDILLTRFSPSPGGTHGHHTASAVLAMEAFKVAGDAKAFPEQGLAPWQPKRIMWNVSTFQKDKVTGNDVLKIDAGGKDPVSGEPFTDIAGASRAMHKTQGFEGFRLTVKDGPRLESFILLDGARATKDIMDDVDTTWHRIPGGAEIGAGVDEIISQFKKDDVAASLPALLKLRAKLAKLPGDDPLVQDKKALLDHIVQACLGLQVETTIAHADVVPGEALKLHHFACLGTNGKEKGASKITVRWTAVRYPSINKEIKTGMALAEGEPCAIESQETLPTSTPLTQPYWLRAEGTPGTFKVEDPKLIGTPENLSSFPIEDIFEVDGQTLVISDQPVQVTTTSSGKESRRRLDVIPPVSLRFTADVALFAPGASKAVEIELTAYRANATGVLHLDTPEGWKVLPAQQPFNLAKVGQRVRAKFTLTAPAHSSIVKLTAGAEMHGVRYGYQREEINYPHIPPQLMHSLAAMKAVCLDVETRSHNIGYLPGAGDSLVQNLEQMGCHVKILDDANLTAEQLQGLDAVVIGVRAFNVRDNIGKALPALFTFVENGGTIVDQYNRPDKLKSEKIAPYDFHISSDRVTDETAAVTFLEPESAVLNTPNKITSKDFDGWVQERGLYFANKWDDHFTPILALNDPGEAPMEGSLLVAKYGKGHFVYTGLSFFRQLPAGVPGAYRLMANLISLGK